MLAKPVRPVLSSSPNVSRTSRQMHIPTGSPGKLLERGVYKLPCMGTNDEIILFAVTSEQRFVADSLTVLPWGTDLPAAAERVCDLLDRVDPVSDEKMKELRRRRMSVL